MNRSKRSVTGREAAVASGNQAAPANTRAAPSEALMCPFHIDIPRSCVDELPRRVWATVTLDAIGQETL